MNNKQPDNKKRSFNKVSNRPFEDAFSPFITTEIQKELEHLDRKIDRLNNRAIQNIRRELDRHKKELTEQVTVLKNSDFEDKFTEIEKKIENIDLREQVEKENITSQDCELKKIKKEVTQLKKKCIRNISITINKNKPIDVGSVHNQFEQLLKIVATGLHVFIVGPAGSGKTTAAQKCAEALGLEYYFTGAIASEFKLTGFINAQGKIVSTDFRKAYTEGGLFLFDEIDASYPQAILAFNAALANDYMDFPDGRKPKHKDFHCIAAANTYGLGADRQYVGRNQLDAASIDRFIFLDWKYDEKLEQELAQNDNWVEYVQSIRKVIEEKKIRHIISPRASIFGAKLLTAGIEKKIVEESILWKGLDVATIELIKKNIYNGSYK